jgi:dihydrofolate synthase/folylpolyglutamate synthase
MSAYTKALDRLYALQKFGIKLGLNSTQNILERLGNPHQGLKCVHLAGTNGKGSVGAMLEATLLAAGIKTGFYTSPHLIHFAERFRLGGREISKTKVLDLINRVWAVCDEREPPTFFEFVTAMAFLYFAEAGAEWTILETGLGGRLDATNVCWPLATVITNIGMEHQEYLGNSLKEIAWEKAGIIKEGVPLVHGVQQSSARKVVEDRALELKAPIIRKGRDISFRRTRSGGFVLNGRLWTIKDLHTNLQGRHQPGNACLAMGALEVMAEAGAAVGPEHFRQGLGKVNWPGRLEKFPSPSGEPSLWLDGAHNLPAARALIESLDLVRQDRYPLVMVVGVMADKDIRSILEILVSSADWVIFSRPRYSRAAEPSVLVKAAPLGAPPFETEPDLARAIDKARLRAGKNGVVLVTGSLFTVGEARAILTGDPTSDLP